MSSASLFPMALGSRWVYQVTDKQPGNEPETSESVATVRAVYLLGENVWYQLEEDDYSLWLQNAELGQYEAQIEFDEEAIAPRLKRKFLVLKANPKVGQKWTYRADLEFEEHSKVECLGVDHPVKVPAGEFRCVVYEIQDGDFTTTLYFAPGWGLVKFTTEELVGTEESIQTEELIKYFPAKQQIRTPLKRGPAKELKVASP